MRSKLRVARTFSFGDWWLFGQAWVLLLVADLGVRVLPLRRVQQLLAAGPRPSPPPPPNAAPTIIAHTQKRVAQAARHHLYPMRCLRQSLALQGLLRRRGIETVLQIGVRRQGERVAAHAWLEYCGRPVGEPETLTADFLPLVPAAHEE